MQGLHSVGKQGNIVGPRINIPPQICFRMLAEHPDTAAKAPSRRRGLGAALCPRLSFFLMGMYQALTFLCVK